METANENTEITPPARKRRTNHGARRRKDGTKVPRKRTATKTEEPLANQPAPSPTDQPAVEKPAPQPLWAVSIPKADMAALPAAPFRGRITLVDPP